MSLNPDKPMMWVTGRDKFDDITNRLRKSASEDLGLGQTLLAEEFTLARAMHAWEVGCAKMDTGYKYEETKIASEVELPDCSGLDEAQILALMDQLFRLEMTFMQGYDFLHTVGSCYYLYDVAKIENPFFRLFCKLMLRSLVLACNVVAKAEVVNEEDSTKIDPHFDVSEENVTGTDKALTSEMTALLKDPALTAPVKQRLNVRKRIFEVYSQLFKEQSAGKVIKGVTMLRKELNKIAPKDTADGDAGVDVGFAFEPNIVRRSVNPAHPPPIQMIVLSFKDAVSVAVKLCDDVEVAFKMEIEGNLDQVMGNLVMYTDRLALALPRSALRCRLMVDHEKHTVHEVGTALLTGWKVSPEFLKYINVPQIMEGKYVQNVGYLSQMIYRALCRTPPRQRRAIRKIIRQCHQMWQHAQIAEGNISAHLKRKQPPYLTCFMANMNMQLCVQFLRLALFDKLYEDDEVEAALANICHLQQNITSNKNMMDSIKVKAVKSKGKKGKQQRAPRIKLLSTLDTIRDAERLIGESAVLTIRALINRGIYKPPVYEMQNNRVRYDYRMNPVTLHSCVYLSYRDFLVARMESMRDDWSVLLKRAGVNLQAGKSKIQALLKSEGLSPALAGLLRTLAKLAVTNTMLSSSLSQIDAMEFNFDCYPYIPTLK